ncbi:unnamed protein product [Eretmochelys imbricata]
MLRQLPELLPRGDAAQPETLPLAVPGLPSPEERLQQGAAVLQAGGLRGLPGLPDPRGLRHLHRVRRAGRGPPAPDRQEMPPAPLLKIVKKGFGCGACQGCQATEDLRQLLKPGLKRQWKCLKRRCLKKKKSVVAKKAGYGPRKLTVDGPPAKPQLAQGRRRRRLPAAGPSADGLAPKPRRRKRLTPAAAATKWKPSLERDPGGLSGSRRRKQLGKVKEKKKAGPAAETPECQDPEQCALLQEPAEPQVRRVRGLSAESRLRPLRLLPGQAQVWRGEPQAPEVPLETVPALRNEAAAAGGVEPGGAGGGGGGGAGPPEGLEAQDRPQPPAGPDQAGGAAGQGERPAALGSGQCPAAGEGAPAGRGAAVPGGERGH